MNIILKRYGFEPIFITLKRKQRKKVNINFLKKYLNLKQINNYFSDINEFEFDYLIVNSDQVWNYKFKRMLETGFLSFSKNWNITKFIYAASMGHNHWTKSKNIIKSVKSLINQFSGISVREKNSIKILHKYFGIKPLLVLDPTMLIDKHNYLSIINNFHFKINPNKKYLCSYILDQSKKKQRFIKDIADELNYKIITLKVWIKNFIEKFIFYIDKCKAIITDSFHGSVFSIIFNKPFLAFINIKRGSARFFSLKSIFHLHGRFIYPKKIKKKDLDALKNKPNINRTIFKILKSESINFLKKNLGLIEK